MEKEFASPTMTIEEKLSKLTPPLLPVECPLAKQLGIPIGLYVYAEAKPGGAPTKGDTNMCAQLLCRRFDGTSRPVRGKALVCLEEPLGGNPSLDFPVDLLVKLLFFTADLVKDTYGKFSEEELAEKMKFAGLFFTFYGPGRNVVKGMSEMVVRGASGEGQVFTLDDLKQQFEAQKLRQMQQQRKQGMPQFMSEPFMQDGKFGAELKEIVERGWTPPSSSKGLDSSATALDGDDGGGDGNGVSGKGDAGKKANGDDDKLDFSDFN